jgi:hypothetical protein
MVAIDEASVHLAVTRRRERKPPGVYPRLTVKRQLKGRDQARLPEYLRRSILMRETVGSV